MRARPQSESTQTREAKPNGKTIDNQPLSPAVADTDRVAHFFGNRPWAISGAPSG
jgi:hypothetical protein